MKKSVLIVLMLISLVGLAGCENQQRATAGVNEPTASLKTLSIERWYSQAQVERGDPLFQTNCASCHKPDASGTPNWRDLDADGKLPPPPLNGTAHAWHHPLSILHRTVRVGGVPLGGTMPGFAETLNTEQINDILAWVQSHWSDEIYRIWHERNAQANKPMQPIKKG
ncbi:MAG: cytochrome c [Candidatus Thiodiazotropha sp. (ex Lucinoma kastoroae)]|nr:cytochrome c [Candidatus Thiodiazotropha sp. (ex Rostrolucina anterorostrata)]MCU7850313.1 cytochrome c [Candidatus Thiodiazotropha sp. (ex Lucinoma kastoroae)]MCU7858445.1 cytochrome c [Candidatus Thiodiazotropha sp. (ex Lucinoma kastoroae)]